MDIIFSGDVVFSQEISNIKMDSVFSDLLEKSDFQLLNLEAPIRKKDTQARGKAGPNIYQHQGYDQIINYYSHISLANNHILDFGKEGLLDTIEYLKNKNKQCAGADISFEEIYKPLILEKDGVKVAILCLGESEFGSAKNTYDTYEEGGYAWTFAASIYKHIIELKKKTILLLYTIMRGLRILNILYQNGEIHIKHL